jgi:hypothetical protein
MKNSDEGVDAQPAFDVFFTHAEISYERTKNPLYAWHVFHLAIAMRQTPARWAADVVNRAMDRLLKLREGDNDAILTALGLRTPPSGRGYPRQYHDDFEAVKAALFPGRESSADFRRARRGRRLLDAVGAKYPKGKNK